MTQEDKQLLFKDLCARLPYGVKVHTEYNLYEGYGKNKHQIGVKEQIGILIGFGDRDNVIISFEDYNWESYSFEDIKPYLRPMSSMTEEEKKEYDALYTYTESCINRKFKIDFSLTTDWFNKNNFDYRGLIEKGLALEAKEGMYKKTHKTNKIE